MDVLILSNNRFSGFNKNPRLLYVTDGDCKIKSFGNLHNNTMFNFHINRQVFYPVSQNFNSFTKVSDTEYKVTVHGFSFYLIGLYTCVIYLTSGYLSLKKSRLILCIYYLYPLFLK